MDESETLLINGEEENGDEFYEKIEAPKFVDLTAPDPYQPGDDRSWFCLRVGCEQNHEEEMDSETIYKNFVLRVMAARSPNVRLQKALCRKDSGTDVKCPQTAPAKPSKSRVTRLALISSISKRIVDPKVKVKPLSKQKATPNTKAKQASAIAKALTTPRTKKQLANTDGFHSVRNLKTTGTAVPDGKTVAKALVFHLPKKAATTKSSLELNTPIKTLCVEMKKLEITSGKKQFLGYNRSLPSDASRKQLRGREVKSRVFDGLCSQNHKIQDAKSSRCLKKNKRENKLQQNHAPVRHERVENDVNDLKIKEKTRNASQGVCSTSKSEEGNTPEGNLIATDISKSPLEDNRVEVSLDSSGNDSNSLLNDDNVSQFPPPREIMERDDKRKTLNSGDKENDSEAMESDDKENASASDDNRELEVVMSHMKHKILGRHEISKTTKAKNKQSKESATPAAVGAQCLKLKKPKPTNPKPFRLRTDERGILKETNLEKKVHTIPLSEVTSVPKVAGGNSQKKQQTAPQRNEKCVQQNENHNDTCEKETKEDSQPQNSTHSFKNAKESVGRKLSFTPQRHTISSQQKLVASQPERSQDKSTPKSMSSSRRTKSPFVRQLSRPQEAASSRKQIISAKKTGKLGTIKETCPTILRAKAAAKPSENGASLATKVSVSSASRRRFTTISKEPNFHTVHMPKSCTRRVA